MAASGLFLRLSYPFYWVVMKRQVLAKLSRFFAFVSPLTSTQKRSRNDEESSRAILNHVIINNFAANASIFVVRRLRRISNQNTNTERTIEPHQSPHATHKQTLEHARGQRRRKLITINVKHRVDF